MPPLRRVAGRATWLLSRANARAQEILLEAFAAEGMRGYHFRLLAALEEHGPSSQADMGRATGIDRSDVVAAVQDLVGWGLVERTPDPVDRRRNVVAITKEGLRTVERVGRRLDRVQEEVLAPLRPSERTTLLRLLRKLG
jgi:DNA-binding MarR family transcriptional regulator